MTNWLSVFTSGMKRRAERISSRRRRPRERFDRAAHTSSGRATRAASAITPRESQRATMLGFLWGVGSAAVLVAIVFFFIKSSKPGEVSPAASVQASDATLTDLEAAVHNHPNNIAARDDLAKAYLDRQNNNAAVEQTQFVLHRAPDDARALTYEALARIANGQATAALRMLQRATRSDPNLLDAWVALAWASARAGRMSEAEAAIGEAKRRRPDQAAKLDVLLARIKPSTAIGIVLRIDPAAHPPARGVLFIMARHSGVSAGPPIAVKRISRGSLPMTVEISAADSMAGEALPQTVRIDVRFDTDGDPMTRSPADLTASQDGVSAGQTIALTLQHQR